VMAGVENQQHKLAEGFREGLELDIDEDGLVDVEDEDASAVLSRHNVHIYGHGKKLLFFGHGFGTNHKIWGGMMQYMDKSEYTMVMYDLLGAYSTDPDNFDPQRYSSLHAYADDLLEVLDACGIERCTYIGHSVSAMVGAIASVASPEVFERIIMIGPSPRYLDAEGYVGGFSLEELDQVFVAMQDNYKVWASGFAPLVVGEDVESPSVREFSRSIFLIRPDVAFCTLKTIFRSDYRALIPQIPVQCHLLHTARDAAVPLEVAEFLMDNIPIVCGEILSLDGHLPHLTHPEIVAKAVLRHIEMPLVSRDEVDGRSSVINGKKEESNGEASARELAQQVERLQVSK